MSCLTQRALMALSVLAAAGATSVFAQPAAPTQLTPVDQRISDPAIQADHRAYEQWQGRIKGLNDRGRPVRDYHLSKAQCWLDVSFHEYTRNDRSDFPQAAMSESARLVLAMEQGASPLPDDTPLVNGAARLRPDLWERAAALKQHRGYACAQQKVACAEVELVHAGNEMNQQQWRHAKPYVQIAEDLLGEGDALAASCLPPPTPAAAPPVPPQAAPVPVPTPAVARQAPPPAVREVRLQARVLFNFDKHELADVHAISMDELRRLAEQVRKEGLVVKALRLSGHADRLNGTGNARYNQQLSERRAATVQAELRRLGVVAPEVKVDASGDQAQVAECQRKFPRVQALQDCLLPNRRVEVTIEAVRP